MILNQINNLRQTGKKAIGVLLDPDKIDNDQSLMKIINLCVENRVDYFLVGGSLITANNTGGIISCIKDNCSIPVLLFPGHHMYLDLSADGLLFLSLISGRNPELLIGQHVVAAPIINRSKIEVISTGYMLVGNGNDTTVSYLSNTVPIPSSKADVAACTALAGEMLGLKMIYLEAGSGAREPVPEKMIKMVRKTVNIPVIVGGGLNTLNKALTAIQAGADMIIIGNGVEKNPNLITEVSEKIAHFNDALNVH